MPDTRPPWYLREAVEMLHKAVDSLDTGRTPRRRLEGALQELIELPYDELLQGPLAERFRVLRAAVRRAPAQEQETAIADNIATMSEAEMQEQMDLIRGLYGDIKGAWDAARGKS